MTHTHAFHAHLTVQKLWTRKENFFLPRPVLFHWCGLNSHTAQTAVFLAKTRWEEGRREKDHGDVCMNHRKEMQRNRCQLSLPQKWVWTLRGQSFLYTRHGEALGLTCTHSTLVSENTGSNLYAALTIRLNRYIESPFLETPHYWYEVWFQALKKKQNLSSFMLTESICNFKNSKIKS